MTWSPGLKGCRSICQETKVDIVNSITLKLSNLALGEGSSMLGSRAVSPPFFTWGNLALSNEETCPRSQRWSHQTQDHTQGF